MKTTRSLLCLLATVLCLSLAPGNLAPVTTADAAPNVRAQVRNRASNDSRNQRRAGGMRDEILANIGENWYLEFTPAYIKAGNSSLTRFLGASFALGWKITHEDKIQLEIGYYASDQFKQSGFKYDRRFNYERYEPLDPSTIYLVQGALMKDITGTIKAKANKVPVLLSYSYTLRLDTRERWEARFTPAIGFLTMLDTWSVSDAVGTFSDNSQKYVVINPTANVVGGTAEYTPFGDIHVRAKENFSGRDTRCVFALGVGVSLTWHFADRWYADTGYRFSWTDKTSANLKPATGTPWNGVLAWTGMNTHAYTATLGWKF